MAELLKTRSYVGIKKDELEQIWFFKPSYTIRQAHPIVAVQPVSNEHSEGEGWEVNVGETRIHFRKDSRGEAVKFFKFLETNIIKHGE